MGFKSFFVLFKALAERVLHNTLTEAPYPDSTPNLLSLRALLSPNQKADKVAFWPTHTRKEKTVAGRERKKNSVGVRIGVYCAERLIV